MREIPSIKMIIRESAGRGRFSWGDVEMRHEHYMLRQVKSVRNACAHSSDILNGIGTIDTRIGTDAAVMDALAKAGSRTA